MPPGEGFPRNWIESGGGSGWFRQNPPEIVRVPNLIRKARHDAETEPGEGSDPLRSRAPDPTVSHPPDPPPLKVTRTSCEQQRENQSNTKRGNVCERVFPLLVAAVTPTQKLRFSLRGASFFHPAPFPFVSHKALSLWVTAPRLCSQAQTRPDPWGRAPISDRSCRPGCNVENVSYGMTVCAERNAIGTAICRGFRKFRAIAVSAELLGQYVPPCGACRQTIAEFDAKMPVFLVRSGAKTIKRVTMEDLLPGSFSPAWVDLTEVTLQEKDSIDAAADFVIEK
ncbi:unnamed protein product [Notodromas monacha]|uniref:CMP/dCMP-type deaminase domain-containing protein n=1 Tax=Notodromas monacha TaxID=399045 RepID=A0A7R9GC08_9CRUS|nr:unnamed protein product [Notodromas monacha]CAG0916969.1 unnamed protein product [Notodromas monacha]